VQEEEEDDQQQENDVDEEEKAEDEDDAQDGSSSSSSSDSDDDDDGVQELTAGNLILNFSDEEEDEEDDDDEDDEEGADKNVDYEKVFKDGSDDDQEDDDDESDQDGKKSVWRDDEDDEVLLKFERESHLTRLLKVKPNAADPGLTGSKMEKRLRDHYLQMHDSKDFSWTETPTERKRKGRDLVRSTDEGFDDSDDSEDDDDFGLPEGMDFSQTSLPLINRTGVFGARLNPDSIRTTFVNYANKQDRAKKPIRSVEFHPNCQLMMAASSDRSVKLFQVDGRRNAKVQGFVLPDLPLHTALFTDRQEANQIACIGYRPFFYVFDLNTGDVSRVPHTMGHVSTKFEGAVASADGKYLALFATNGTIAILSGKTKNWIYDLKASDRVRSACFSKDGLYLFTTGDDRDIYKWDLRSRRCVRRIPDDGSTGSLSIAISPDEKYLATGEKTGVVNVYNLTDFETSKKPVPIKSILNLTTACDTIKFNHDSQLLTIGSSKLENQLKLVHVPSFTVFPDWPTQQTPLDCVTGFDYSPNSGFLAVANIKGRVPLFRMHHYQQI